MRRATFFLLMLASIAPAQPLRLSLRDAIAMAVESNLDVQVQRYSRQLAATDLQRAKAGSALRGIPLSVREGPQSLGAPSVIAGRLAGGDAPALNRLSGVGAQMDLSLLGSLPLSTGRAVPVFDPIFTARLGWNHTSQPQNSTFLSTLNSLNANTTAGGAGFEKGFASGGSLAATFDNTHQSINNPLLSFSPYSASSLGVTFRQPLLRGFGPTVATRYIRIARNNQRVSDLVFEQQLISTVDAVVRLYWDLVSLQDDVRVRKNAVASAEQLLSDTREAANAGVRAAIDVTRAQAEVAKRQRDLFVAESLAEQQSELMKDYLTGAKPGALENVQILPTEPAGEPLPDTGDALDQLVQQALQARPDLAQARLQIQNSEIALVGSRSGLKPSLDVVASAQNNGLAGEANGFRLSTLPPSTPNPALLGGYGSSLSQVFRRNYPDYGVAIQLSLPILNRAARADVTRDEIQVHQQQIRLQQLEKQARLEIRTAQIAVNQARASVVSTHQERQLQEATLAAEKEKLDVGASTLFLVIEYQRDLTQAQSAEASARASYWKARAALDRAKGSTLVEYGIDLEAAHR
jgi:outer membrane protein